MTRNGIASELRTLALPISEIASGSWVTQGRVEEEPRLIETEEEEPKLWPTPTWQDGHNDGGESQFKRYSLPLNAAVKVWPTPVRNDGRRSTQGPVDGKRGRALADVARGARIWPTPRFSGGHESGGGELSTYRRTPSQEAGKHGLYLQSEVCEEEMTEGRAPGQLNPTWVEWLMGFPLGWTDLPPSGTP